MPYAHISHAPRSTLDDYRAVNDDIGDPRPEGLLLTILGGGTDGLFVIDLWRSKADADRFAAERLLPAFTRTGRGPDATATYSDFEVSEIVAVDDLLDRCTRPEA